MNRLYTLFQALALVAASSCGGPQSTQSEESADEATEEPATAVPNGVFTYTADTINMQGYFATKVEGDQKVPGVLVIHEWWGHNDYARQRADMLADLGYVAFALDMYGDGQVADHPEDAGKFAGMVMSNIDVAKQKFEAALEALKNHPQVDASKIAAIGYCFGGTVAMNMANAGYDLDAVAAFHSGLNFPIKAETAPGAKILVCNGADDPFIPAESIDAFKTTMDAVGADYEYVAYEGAVHSFTSKEADANGEKFGLPLAYNAEADAASWQKMQELFASVF
ncbi:MAG: dienelactone hydrolase family protein [Bacteroidota bacterium]